MLAEIPQLGIQTIVADDAAIAAYRKDPTVLWVEPNAMRYPLLSDPDDPFYNTLDTNLPSDPSDATWYKWDTHLILAVDGWNIWPGKYFTAAGKGAAAVKIAVIDTGVDYTHPDFINAGGTGTDTAHGGQLLRPLDRTIFSGIVTPDAADGFGHGTHVTGIAAAATNNGAGVTGNGYNANVISIRVTDDSGNGTASDLARAIIYAVDNGAVIANVSLGDYAFSQAEQDAINYAWMRGMLVVAATGNDGATTPPPAIYPAALSRVLAVSATSRDDSLASYSSYGDWVGICAPGGDFDFTANFFLGVYSTTPTYTVTLNDPQYGLQNNYDYLEGTSMASPQVTGAAALYAGQHGFAQATPNAPLQIWQALQRAAEGIPGSDAWGPIYGWGRVNIYNLMNLDAVPNPRGDAVGTISGQVRYKGTPVLNANIVATPVGGGAGGSGSSRGDGGYRIPNIGAGAYNLTATYFGETQVLTNVVVTAGCDIPGIDFNVGVPKISIAAVTLNPAHVVGSMDSSGTVRISGLAPAGGLDVSLSSSDTSVATPATTIVTVPAGLATARFTVNTKVPAAPTAVRITATAPDNSSKTAVLAVLPITVRAITITPNAVAGGRAATGRVDLDGPAGPGGLLVGLASSNSAVASPAVSSLVFAQGLSTATFSITTRRVTMRTNVTITASAGGHTMGATLKVGQGGRLARSRSERARRSTYVARR